MSVMTVTYRETLHRTLLFLRRTMSDVRRLLQALKLEVKFGNKSLQIPQQIKLNNDVVSSHVIKVLVCKIQIHLD